jgi:hypothetical protein
MEADMGNVNGHMCEIREDARRYRTPKNQAFAEGRANLRDDLPLDDNHFPHDEELQREYVRGYCWPYTYEEK